MVLIRRKSDVTECVHFSQVQVFKILLNYFHFEAVVRTCKEGYSISQPKLIFNDDGMSQRVWTEWPYLCSVYFAPISFPLIKYKIDDSVSK